MPFNKRGKYKLGEGLGDGGAIDMQGVKFEIFEQHHLQNRQNTTWRRAWWCNMQGVKSEIIEQCHLTKLGEGLGGGDGAICRAG